MLRYFKLFILLLSVGSLNAAAQNASSIIPDSVSRKDTARQTDLIDIGKTIVTIKKKPIKVAPDKNVYFSILPSSTVPGGTGRALVTSTTAGMYLGPKETTNLSTATFAPYWNFKNRYGLPLHTSIWFPDNTWTVQGDTRFLHYPQFTWGLGTTNSYIQSVLVDYNYIRFYQNVLKQIQPFLFVGVGYALDFHSNIHADDPGIDLGRFTQYEYGIADRSLSSGITLNLLYDSRNTEQASLPGAYANIVYRVNPTFLGSNNLWNSIYIDFRKYLSMNPAKPAQQNTLAFWSYFWSTLNTRAPYLDLPSIGWDPYNRSGRGIDQSRYRGQSLFYFETEYRRDITRNGLLGFVLFSNINTVSGSGTMFRAWHPAAGGGLRVKFNKGSRTNVGADYGFSKNYRAILFSVGEAF